MLCCLLSLFFGAAGAALFAKLWYGFPDRQRILKAKALVLVDDSGAAVSYLGHDNEGRMALFFYSKTQQPVAAFGVNTEKSPFLEFRGRDNEIRGILQYDVGENPSLVFASPSSKSSLFLGASASDTPDLNSTNEDNWALVLRTPDGRQTAAIQMAKNPLNGNFGGEISVVDATGKRWGLPPTDGNFISKKSGVRK